MLLGWLFSAMDVMRTRTWPAYYPPPPAFDFNTRDSSGETVLHASARCRNPMWGGIIARWLCTKGADVTIKNNSGHTASDVGNEVHGKSIFDVFLDPNLRLNDSRKTKSFVFLSWTKRLPREAAAMRAVMDALARYHVPYFDFSNHRVEIPDDQEKASLAIHDRMVKHAFNCDFSIEVISSDAIGDSSAIEGHPWIQVERALLREFDKKRIFIVLDIDYMFKRGTSEGRILRLDGSFGTIGRNMDTPINPVTKDTHLTNPANYKSPEFLHQCDVMARTISLYYDQGLDIDAMLARLQDEWFHSAIPSFFNMKDQSMEKRANPQRKSFLSAVFQKLTGFRKEEAQ